MRQAGRYLPEYNATRKRAGSFMQLCTSPDLATEVTLQPLVRFPLDAAILFSDSCRPSPTRWAWVALCGGEGPRFRDPLVDEVAIDRLHAPDLSSSNLRVDAVPVRSGERSMGGYRCSDSAGSPFTLACYMIEGAGSAISRAYDARCTRGPTCCIACCRSTRTPSPRTSPNRLRMVPTR